MAAKKGCLFVLLLFFGSESMFVKLTKKLRLGLYLLQWDILSTEKIVLHAHIMIFSPCVVDLCVIDQQLCKDENSLLSFEAIRSIHKLMDDDADGTVDMTETDEVRRKHSDVVYC